jgi:hypothetical protein
MSNHISTLGVILLGAAALSGGSYGVVRATRGTQSTKIRRHYSVLLTRAASRLALFEKSLKELRRVKDVTPPKLFTLDTDEVEELLRRIHRRETQSCLALAILNNLKVETEVPATSAQVLKQRKLGKRLGAAVRELRKLELEANAKGVRLDRARPCNAAAPNVADLQREIEKRSERRLTARARARSRQKQTEREKAQQKRDKKRHVKRGVNHVGLRIRELAEAAGHDEEQFENLLAEDHELLTELAEDDPQVLVEFAQDYPLVWEAAKSLGLLDETGNMFEE